MARPQVEETHQDEDSFHSIPNDEVDDLDEEEFHTASSNLSDGDDDESRPAPTAQLLPAELLKPLPTPIQSLEEQVPWERLTRKQKVARRNQRRQAKKRTWDQLRKVTSGTAVLKTGAVAQVKRGVMPLKERVRDGRVDKRTAATKSGRQQLVETRKRLVKQKNGVVTAPSVKKARTVKDKR